MNRIVFCIVAVLFLGLSLAAQTPPPDPAAANTEGNVPAGVTATVSPEIAQFQKIDDSWSNGVNQRDQYSLELVLSPLFVNIAADGDVTTRNQQVAQVLSGEDKTLNLTQKVITVRMLGDIAVANGTYILHHKVNSGEVDEKGVFTQVFERAHGNWLCINSQRTTLREDASAKQKKQSSPRSPLHIPLFSKSEKGPQ